MKKRLEVLYEKLKKKHKEVLTGLVLVYILLFCTIFIYFFIKSVTPTSTKIIPKPERDKQTKMVYKNSSDICVEIFKCYNEGIYGPMMSVKGMLENDSIQEEVHWIFLGGLEKVKNQTTTMKESILSALNLDNTYKKNVKKNILTHIPKGSSLILSGHSLGGMVSQQLAADKDINTQYKILYIIGFGSPYVSTKPKEGKLIRLADRNDIIGHMTFINPFTYKHKETKSYREKSSYYFKCPAHLWSYNDYDIWKGYDVIGSKTKHTTFTFIEEEKQYFKSTYSE